MAANLYDRLVSDHEYVQRVRRHRPSALLPVVAAASARWKDSSYWNSPYMKYTPWALAETARVSLAYGNEHRGDGSCTEEDLLRILAAYSQLTDMMIRDNGTYEAVSGFMLRMSGQQLTYQGATYNALARTAALFEQTQVKGPLRCMTAGWANELLGCSLSDYVGVTMLLQVAAYQNAGRFDPAWLDQPQFREICAVIPAETIRRVVETHFVVDQPAFKAANERRISRDPHLRRFEYNPLRGQPFLRGFGPGYLAPNSHLIAPKGSPLGLFYMGVARYGNAFAEDLGHLFEQYVGRNLRQIPNATVHAEVLYNRDNRRSVDWIVAMDDLTLLVEVKSTRPTQPMRLGVLERTSAVQKQLTHAYEQIDTTAALIKEGHPDFSHIPRKRPLQGLVVTLEAFHTANANFQRDQHPDTDTFVTVCSAEEIEHLVTVEDRPVDQLLLERQGDVHQSTYSLSQMLVGRQLGRNQVLDAGWQSYPWNRNPQLNDQSGTDHSKSPQ